MNQELKEELIDGFKVMGHTAFWVCVMVLAVVFSIFAYDFYIQNLAERKSDEEVIQDYFTALKKKGVDSIKLEFRDDRR